MKVAYTERKFRPDTLETVAQASVIVDDYQAQGLALTLRQLYYQFVARGLFENTERNYKRLSSVLSDARRVGLIDWEAIEDRTRFLRSMTRWISPDEILEATVNSYHKDLWEGQEYRVEVWIEKDALTGVIEQVCQENDAPFFSCRGFVSDSEMWSAGYHRVNGEQTLVVLHLGDHDPSGIDMTRDIEDRLRLFSEGKFIVQRIALTMEQVREVNPPPNPTKLTDSRAQGYVNKYGSESWELDALDPTYIRDLVEKNINYVRDKSVWDNAVKQQEYERKSLADLIGKIK